MNNLPDFLTKKYLAWQAELGQRKTLEDFTEIRQTLMGIIDQVKADRIGKHVVVKLDFYHVSKGEYNYVYNSSPRGGTSYRHSLSFEGTIPNTGRPNKKPLA